MPIRKVPNLVNQLYATVRDLEELFPHRRFTPDGILVGSLGEVLAAHHYGLTLLPQNAPVHDAKCPQGRLVQIKTTQRSSIDIRELPEHLLVVRLEPAGFIQEVYNGPGKLMWDEIAQRPMPKAGFYSISLSRLRRLATQVHPADKIELQHPMAA